jgi:hypothetical protein
VLPELRLVGQRFGFRPSDLERIRAADRVPFAGRDDAEKIALAYDPGEARDFLGRGIVHFFELGADGRRPYHTPIEHAGHTEILHVGEAASDLVGNVDPRDRLADDLVVLRRFFLHRLLGVELDREAFAADQFAIADLFASPGPDDAVGNSEIIRAELLGGFREQRLARSGRGLPQLHPAKLNREAAPGRALVGCEQRVASNQLDAAKRHVELVSYDLAQRRRDACAEIDLATIGGDLAGLVDGKERVDFSKGERLG